MTSRWLVARNAKKCGRWQNKEFQELCLELREAEKLWAEAPDVARLARNNLHRILSQDSGMELDMKGIPML